MSQTNHHHRRGPGLMQAANEGAAAAGPAAPGRSVGIRVDLPFEQVRKLYRTPLILIGPMWAELVEWTRTYLLRPEFQLASPADIEIPRCVNTAEEAIALIRKHHEQWIVKSAPPLRSDK